MSAHEWALWKEYYKVAPWDDQREYVQAGLVCSTIANFAGKILKKGTKPTTARDFMPVYSSEEDPDVPSDPMSFFSTVNH